MDLLSTIRKEGSRGGRSEFKWDDVKASQHRENYLGHSLMAPVGRWQNNKDLSWYASGDRKPGASESPSAEERADAAAAARRAEIQAVKEAEQDAMAAALGFAVEPRRATTGFLADPAARDVELKRAVAEVDAGVPDELDPAGMTGAAGGRGVGFGGFGGSKAGDARPGVWEEMRGHGRGVREGAASTESRGGLLSTTSSSKDKERLHKREVDGERRRRQDKERHSSHRRRHHYRKIEDEETAEDDGDARNHNRRNDGDGEERSRRYQDRPHHYHQQHKHHHDHRRHDDRSRSPLGRRHREEDVEHRDERQWRRDGDWRKDRYGDEDKRRRRRRSRSREGENYRPVSSRR
ncbi:MAG: hypothetical protein M1825_003897 [Sarcosagium campestre]|nr:MAG: hypothetical protein M1825_003897 [Sarcosagium campestre]